MSPLKKVSGHSLVRQSDLKTRFFDGAGPEDFSKTWFFRAVFYWIVNCRILVTSGMVGRGVTPIARGYMQSGGNSLLCN